MAKKPTIRDAEEVNEATPERHALHLPSMYIGQIKPKIDKYTVCRINEDGKLYFESDVEINIAEGVENILREVIINARDAITEGRDDGNPDNEITIKVSKKKFTIRNGGKVLPVVKSTVIREGHEYEVFKPSQTFFKMFSGSNYDKDIGTTKILKDTSKNKRNTGRNGVGSKMANIFSIWFEARVFDGKKHFSQVARTNMSEIDEPVIIDATEEDKDLDPYVEVSFILDFERFELECYNDDILCLIRYHCCSIAYNSHIRFNLNDQIIEPLNVYQFMALEYPHIAKDDYILGYTWPNGIKYKTEKTEWGPIEISLTECGAYELEYVIAVTEEKGRSMSFVNGNITREGGLHVDAVHKACKFVLDEINKKVEDKKAKINIGYLKSHLCVLVNANVKGLPGFNNNTKTKLVDGKFDCELSKKNIKLLNQSKLKELLEFDLEHHAVKIFDDKKGSKKLPLKLTDALMAKKKRSKRDGKPCFLVLTEGDSALLYAKNYFADDRDHYGTLPLRGKIVNVRKIKSTDQLIKKKEFKAIKAALGLELGVDYSLDENMQTLRYDGVLIAGDEDVDGFHLKGLIVNIFELLWPELARSKAFLLEDFVTSIITVDHGKKRYTFQTIPEYQKWCEDNPTLAKLTPEYKKGLASHSKEEIVKDKKNGVNKHVLLRVDEHATGALDLAFRPDKTAARRDWILAHDASKVVEIKDEVNVSDFVNDLVIYHAKDSLERTMASFDGFKQSSRKIATLVLLLYAAGQFKEKDRLKTVALGGKVIDSMEFFHGEQSLYKTIERLTQGQNHPGTSNLPFLGAGGLFSDRTGLKGGQARYTSSRAQSWWKHMFKKVDLEITPRRQGETKVNGKIKEIEFMYIPQVLPYLLMNFTSSIGTGWNSYIPGCRPKHLLEFIRRKLKGEETTPLRPWAWGFKGSMRMVKTSELKKADKEAQEEEEEKSEDQPKNHGDDEEEENPAAQEERIPAGDNSALYSLIITGKWNVEDGGTVVVTEIPIGKTFVSYGAFLYKLKENGVITDYDDLCQDGVPCFRITGMEEPSDEKLNLRRVIKLSNMYILDENNKPLHFHTLTEIADAWYEWNLPHYVYRRKMMIQSLKQEVEKLHNKAEFIRLVNDRTIEIHRRKKAEILADAETHGIKTEYVSAGMTLWSLTEEDEAELRSTLETRQEELKVLKESSPEDLWLQDLEELEPDLY